MKTPWIVFFDLDGTLWDHLDITATNPPFTRISESVISDSRGVNISLLPGSVEFLKWVRAEGGIISTCSWNEYDKAIGALETFGLVGMFDFQKISTDPKKYLLMVEVIDHLNLDGKNVQQKRMFYIDDRDIHFRDVKTRFPEMTFFNVWRNGTDFEVIKKGILSIIEEK